MLLPLATLVLAWVAGAHGRSEVAPLPPTSCGPVVFHGLGQPDYLIVSDLPLRAPPGAMQQVKGIRYVLEQRHYTAGKFKVGYQSCDDSSAATGGRDPARCTANAKAYARNPSVLGVIGPYNSECAALEIPIANASPTGPLVMIGTGTTDPSLTSAVSGGAIGTPAKFYPSGKRSFVRLTAPDQYQAAAAALLARRHLSTACSWSTTARDTAARSPPGSGVTRARSAFGLSARAAEPEAADYGRARGGVRPPADGVYLAGSPSCTAACS